jgi:hypothetical protein
MLQVSMDTVDALNTKLATLHASLTIINGEGLENFRDHSTEMQDAYLYGCAQLACECKALVRAVTAQKPG